MTDDNLWTHHQTVNKEHLSVGHPRQDMFFKEIQKRVKKGKLLEIGFGDGYLLRKLSKKYTCFGTDISQENVLQSREECKNITFDHVAVDCQMPYQDDFFDCFVASEVLEHMDDKNLQINIREMLRILKSGGYAFITVPAKESLKDNECFCPSCDHIFHRWGHKQSFDVERIEGLFQSFDIIQKKIFFTPCTKGSVFYRMMSRLLCLVRSMMSVFVNNMPNQYYLIILKKR